MGVSWMRAFLAAAACCTANWDVSSRGCGRELEHLRTRRRLAATERDLVRPPARPCGTPAPLRLWHSPVPLGYPEYMASLAKIATHGREPMASPNSLPAYSSPTLFLGVARTASRRRHGFLRMRLGQKAGSITSITTCCAKGIHASQSVVERLADELDHFPPF